MTVTLADGRRETATIDFWTGAPGRDLGREGLMAKYTENCAVAGISPSQSRELADALFGLLGQEPVAKLFQCLSKLSLPNE